MLLSHTLFNDSQSDDKTSMNPPSDYESLILEKMH